MVISWKSTGKVLDVVYVACNSIIGIQKTLEGSRSGADLGFAEGRG